MSTGPPNSPQTLERDNFSSIRSPKDILEFRQTIREQLMRGMKTSPDNKKEKKMIQNKLKIKEATKEIVVS